MKKKILFFIAQIIVLVLFISSCKKESLNTPANNSLPAFLVGQNYGGGTVFYVDGTGQHGLIAGASSQKISVQWYNGSFIETPAKGIKVGTGRGNTSLIIGAQGTGEYAASICDELEINGYNDWFLPSKDELNLLYLQKAAGNVQGLANNFYWSSTEDSFNGAWSQSFSNGSNSSAHKDGTYYICPIRAF